MSEVIELKLTRREAHVILRALAAHDDKADGMAATWVAERILRIVSPELGPQPIAAIFAKAEEYTNPGVTPNVKKERRCHGTK